MGHPIAKQDDAIVAQDIHFEVPPGGAPSPMPHAFRGPLSSQLASSVYAGGKVVALIGSQSSNSPPHIPTVGPFQKPPANIAEVAEGSTTVFANGTAVARNGDPADACDDLGRTRNGHVVASGTVLAG